MTYEAFLDCLDHSRRRAGGHVACCPAHADRSPSLNISEGDDGRILLHDFAGCSTEEILECLGLSLADLFPGKQTRESWNHAREVKSISRQIKQEEGFQADVYREADQFLESVKEIDLSEWSPEEKDRAMNLVCKAYEIQRKEEGYYEKRQLTCIGKQFSEEV